MPPIYLLIKPASGRCNMRCRYCFYADETQNRETSDFGMMAEETLETVIRKALAHATGGCTFGFQGGEPTLRGLEFYKKAVALQKQYNADNMQIDNALQTNGLLLTDEWAEFLKREKFLVGLSIDGTTSVHNKNRVDFKGEGTLRRAMDAAALLKKHQVDFNVLTVVTNGTAGKIGAIYDFFMERDLPWQQYIPCLDPFGKEAGWLTPEYYALFLKTLFSRWSQDIMRGRFVYIRQFENYIGMLLGKPPESCGMMGHCTNQYVVEADGGVYPCDFYAMDPYRLGSFVTDSFEQLDKKRAELRFIEDSLEKDAECSSCPYYPLCRGGCRRDRDTGASLERNRFCAAYKEFFAWALPVMKKIADGCR